MVLNCVGVGLYAVKMKLVVLEVRGEAEYSGIIFYETFNFKM